MPKTARSKQAPDPLLERERVDVTARATPSQEEIALRAYQISIERGDAEGSPLEDWLQAERELISPQ